MFTAELSADGVEWTEIGSTTVAMSGQATIGLFATSHDNTVFSTAEFDSVTVDAGDPASDWTCQDVGDPQSAGDAVFNPDGSVEVTGAGDDVWGDADQFHYCHRELPGDGEIIARVVSQEHTNDWAKSGVMVKSAATAGADYAAALVTPAHGVHLQSGFDTDVEGDPAAAAPAWLRLVRSGDTVTAYQSDDGVAWEPFGSAAVAGPATIGLFVSSHDGSEPNTTVFDSVEVEQTAPGVPEPWTCEDVGGPRIPGDASFAADGTVTVVGAGDDIWDQTDQFHYCHQELTGDGEIIARVVSQEHTNDWAKSGVMVKTAATAGADYAALMLTPPTACASRSVSTPTWRAIRWRPHRSGCGWSGPGARSPPITRPTARRGPSSRRPRSKARPRSDCS
ncbi:hypothetical protein GCM10029992_64390 [Glycomyces albus]